MSEINTKTVPLRRLRFNEVMDIQAEADRLAAAHKAGKLKQNGNWTAGQIFNHLASWASYPYDGYPKQLSKPPWIIRFILNLKRKTYLNDKMPQGIRIPGIKEGTMATEVIGIEDGYSKLQAALKRLNGSPPTIANPIFGPLSHDDWKRINMRHAELHMGFLEPL